MANTHLNTAEVAGNLICNKDRDIDIRFINLSTVIDVLRDEHRIITGVLKDRKTGNIRYVYGQRVADVLLREGRFEGLHAPQSHLFREEGDWYLVGFYYCQPGRKTIYVADIWAM